jgi:CRP-like cAMP-binding protein
MRRIEPHAVAIATRAGQKLAPATEGGETAYLVVSGVLVCRAALPGGRHQIMSVFYPGDIFCTRLMPPLAGAVLSAATASGEVWRLPWPLLEAAAGAEPEIARFVSGRLMQQAARAAMHAFRIGSLTGEERVASLLIELALRTGTPVGQGVAFELPLARTDMADYLALNADTVSRIVSRLRVKGLLAQSGRRRLICRDLSALEKECPISGAITQMHRPVPPPCSKA